MSLMRDAVDGGRGMWLRVSTWAISHIAGSPHEVGLRAIATDLFNRQQRVIFASIRRISKLKLAQSQSLI